MPPLKAVRIKVPLMPYYERQAFIDLHGWADGIVDKTRRENLSESDYEDIAEVLRKVAASEAARRAIFPSERRGKGRPMKYRDRDYLVALEYWVRRDISSRKRRGLELRDRDDTVQSWREWKISEDMLERARTRFRKRCKSDIEKYITNGGSPRHGYSAVEILSAMLDGIHVARRQVWSSV